jgi:hypothetical protein
LESVDGSKVTFSPMSQTSTLQKCFGTIPIPYFDTLF